jgi:hypothetical protein
VAGDYRATLTSVEQQLRAELNGAQPDAGPAQAQHEARRDAEKGAETRLDLPGVHLSAREGGATDLTVGGMHVSDSGAGATVRLLDNVRLRGEALSRERRGFRALFVLTGDNSKAGWRTVGYSAGGPKVGPITVAIVKSRHAHDDLLSDVKKLVHHNGGV